MQYEQEIRTTVSQTTEGKPHGTAIHPPLEMFQLSGINFLATIITTQISWYIRINWNRSRATVVIEHRHPGPQCSGFGAQPGREDARHHREKDDRLIQ